MQEHLVQLDNVKLWTISQGQGLPLMLCNGGPGCCDYLEPMAAMMSDLVRVHRWEQRGCGRSAAVPPYDHATCLSDLESLRTSFGYDRAADKAYILLSDHELCYCVKELLTFLCMSLTFMYGMHVLSRD